MLCGSFFLFMDSIQLCEYASLFIRFSLEHLLYFQVLCIMNKAGTFPFLLGKYLEKKCWVIGQFIFNFF